MIAFLLMIAASVALTTGSKVPGSPIIIDLSDFNSDVDLAAAKAGGIKMVIHRASVGTGTPDTLYLKRRAEAKSLGLKWGAYHFANFSEGAAQAQFFLKTVGNDVPSFIALDLEPNPAGPSADRRTAEDFVDTIKKATGRFPYVYGSTSSLERVMGGHVSFVFDCPLWIAEYKTFSGSEPVEPTLPRKTGWHDWDIWQYTDGTVGSEPRIINGVKPCDRDTLNPKKTLDDL